MGGPGVAVDTAMLAPAVGVDRDIEVDVGRVVAGEDGLEMMQNKVPKLDAETLEVRVRSTSRKSFKNYINRSMKPSTEATK